MDLDHFIHKHLLSRKQQINTNEMNQETNYNEYKGTVFK
jgi:hypothetical protein